MVNYTHNRFKKHRNNKNSTTNVDKLSTGTCGASSSVRGLAGFHCSTRSRHHVYIRVIVIYVFLVMESERYILHGSRFGPLLRCQSSPYSRERGRELLT